MLARGGRGSDRHGRRHAVSLVLVAALLALLLPGLRTRSLDTPLEPPHFRIRTWGLEDGLPSNAVNAIAQTRDGYLWLGTEGGLVRFDGDTFQVVAGMPEREFQTGGVSAILEASDGSLWYGTDGAGLVRMRDRAFTRFTTADGLPNDRVLSIAEDRDGKIWIGTRGPGVTVFSGGKLVPPKPVQGMPRDEGTVVGPDRQGGVWVASRSDLTHVRRGAAETVPLPESVARCGILGIYADRSGILWLLTPCGLTRFEEGRFSPFGKQDGFSAEKAYFIGEDREGSLWVGTYGKGLGRLSGGRWTAFGRNQRLPDERILSFCEDREGNLWFGTRGGGLVQFRRCAFAAYTEQGGLPAGMVRPILEDSRGAVWIGLEGGGLARWADGRITAFGKGEGLSDESVYSAYEDRDGALWFGTGDGRVNRFFGGRFTAHTFQRGAPPYRVSAIHRDRQGTLWIGTRGGGVTVMKNGRFLPLDLGDQTEHLNVHQFFESPQGSLWIVTSQGLITFKEGAPSRLQVEGDPLGHPFFCLHPGRDGCLWAGTYGGGLVRIKGGKASRITSRQGLHEDVVYQILEDSAGYLWMSGNNGISRIAVSDLEECAEGRRRSVKPKTFGLSDGLPSVECNGGSQPAGCRTRAGRLWFPTTRGAAVVDPLDVPSNLLPPPVHIERCSVNGSPVDLWKPCAVPAGQGIVEIHYAGLSFADPKQVRFRYRMEGFDRGWVDAGTRRTAYYTGLPSGRYRFRVIASNDDGVWNTSGASVALSLDPPFYKRWWFVVPALALGVLLLLAAYRLRVRFYRQRGRELERKVSERTSELQAQKNRLETMEDLYRAIVDDQAELVCRFAPDGTLTFVNRAFSQFLVAPPPLGGTTNFFDLIPPEKRQTIRVALESLVSAHPTELIEHEMHSWESGPRLHQWSHRAFFDEGGRITGFQSVGRDITERRELEEKVLTSQKLEAVGQLAGGVAHDFNNLLQAMLSAVDLLRKEPSGGTRVAEVATDLEGDIRRGSKLVRQLLLFSKREAAKPVQIDLNTLVEEVQNLLARIVREDIRFRVERCAGPLPVLADQGQIEQALVNLVVNASDAMGGGGDLLIRTGQEGGDRVWVEVADTGTGIPDEIRGRIFDPFFSTKGAEVGTGLGLAVVHGIVQQHGGTIDLKSQLGSGTTFRILLPRAGDLREPAASTETAPEGPLPALEGRRLLLVEDDADVREWLEETLSLLGCQVTAASTAQETEALPSAPPFDVVLSDFVLPDSNGVELVRRLRERWSGIAVILMSGYAQDFTLKTITADQRIRFLHKPFSIESLDRELRAAMGEVRPLPGD